MATHAEILRTLVILIVFSSIVYLFSSLHSTTTLHANQFLCALIIFFLFLLIHFHNNLHLFHHLNLPLVPHSLFVHSSAINLPPSLYITRFLFRQQLLRHRLHLPCFPMSPTPRPTTTTAQPNPASLWNLTCLASLLPHLHAPSPAACYMTRHLRFLVRFPVFLLLLFVLWWRIICLACGLSFKLNIAFFFFWLLWFFCFILFDSVMFVFILARGLITDFGLFLSCVFRL